MFTATPDPRSRLHSRSLLVLFFLVTACLSEDPADPEPTEPPAPEPPPATLLCASYVSSGYTEKTSYYPGEKMQVFLESVQAQAVCQLTMYTVTGDSLLTVASGLPALPALPPDASENGYQYPVAVELTVPELKSGIYLIEKKIPFIVKTSDPMDVMVVYPSNTANAYALSGGKSLYSTQQRPTAVSFHRPIPLQSLSEFCLKWFTTLDLRIGYVADVDMDQFENIRHAKVLVIPGHSEYWTRKARQNFDQFVDQGGHALILSGNTMWWQVRYSEDQNKLICYKNNLLDPIEDPLLKTIEWSTPSLEYSILSSIGAHFPNGGYGLRPDQGWNGYKIAAPTSPLFENTGLQKGDIIPLPSLEYDGAPLSGYDETGYPIINTAELNFDKVELLAFDKGFRGAETTATFIIFRKTATSGVVINTSTTDWCSSNGMGGQSGSTIKRITHNALIKLLNDEPVFSP